MFQDGPDGQARAARRHAIHFCAIICGVAFLPACQDERPTVSLAEAKQITAKFEGTLFVPPPRTVKDLLAELDAMSASGDKILASLRAKANAPAPNTDNQSKLSQHFAMRAESTRMLGNYTQALEDAQRALDLATGDERRAALSSLALAHEELGNYRKALEIYEKRAALASRTGQFLVDDARLTSFRALVGDLQGAEKALASARSRVPQMSYWTRDLYLVPMLESLVDKGEGDVSVKQGDYPRAEKALRRVGRVMDREIASGGSNDEIVETGRTVQVLRYGMQTYVARVLSLAVLRQGRLVEAEVIARDTVLKQARLFGRYSGQTLEGLQVLSEIVTEQGRFKDAEGLIRASLDIFDRIGAKQDSTTRGITRRTLADTYVSQERWQQAQEVYDSLARDLGGKPAELAPIFDANLNWAIPLIRLNRGAEAAARLEKTYARLSRQVGGNHYDTAEAQGMLASALASIGRTQPALDAFAKAVPILLSRDSLSEREGATRSGQLIRQRFILESYIDVLTTVGASGGKLPDGADAIEEAFRIADAARGGTVKQALSSSAARAAIADSELAALARREQNAMHEIGALNGLLRNAGGADSKATETLTARIAALKAARSALMEEITRRFPDYADVIDSKPATVAEVRKDLRSGEALVSTYSTAERTYVWAVPQSAAIVFSKTDLGRQKLADMVGLLRGAVEPTGTTLGDVAEFDLATAYGLYQQLLAPVRDGWKEAKNLLVVTHGPLGYLPLSVLPTEKVSLPAERKQLFSNYQGVPWLARTHAVTMLPSVASLKSLRRLPAGDEKRLAFVGFGDPLFGGAAVAKTPEKPAEVATLTEGDLVNTRRLPMRRRAAPATEKLERADLAVLPRLPDTGDEIKSIALALNADLTKSVFVGKEASEGRVKSMDLSGVRVLAFATHGLVPGDLDGLTQPALALSSPKVVGGIDDGLLTMGEILGLKLNADWVVLSACNTGSGEGAGAEAVSGLGRAFFYAGTRALLVSNWPVESASAKALTTDLFRRQAADPALSRAEALRRAMIGLIEGPGHVDPKSGKIVYSYAHPLFWAPFTLVGDGGMAKPGA